jgi:lysophospholipid acyltransferase (LPLAT)-like uncharacterized protein
LICSLHSSEKIETLRANKARMLEGNLATFKEYRRRWSTAAASWAIVGFVFLLKWTCRVKTHNDPRQSIKANGGNYVYALMHAYQILGVMYAERGVAAMVSRNYHGQYIIPTMRVRGMIAVRGSTMRQGKASKGGLAALEEIITHVSSGKSACLAVDGPAGPRGCAHKGIAVLSIRTGAFVVPMVSMINRKWVVKRSWDRMQIPKPFARIDAYFGEPMLAREDESSEEFRIRIENSLIDLECQHVPEEARFLYRQPTEFVSPLKLAG